MPTRIISSGQTSTVSSGVTDTSDVVLSSGTEIVASGGIASATTIQFGGFEQVMAGGTAAATAISGGTLEIQSGGLVGSGGATFSGTGGVFRVDGTTMPTSTISGFTVGDTIDLAGVSFANGGGVQLGTGNVLTVTEGGTSYTLNLNSGQSYSGKSFRLLSDGSGGTDIQVANGLSINVTYDSSVSGAPVSFTTDIAYVVNTFEHLFLNAATINIAVGYGELNGSSLGGALGQSQQEYIVDSSFGSSFSYSAVRQALINENAPGASTLPISSPGTRVLGIGPAELKALGLITSTGFGSALDGAIAFSSDTSNSFSYAINTVPSPFSSFYFVGVVEHELSELMGRTSLLNFLNDMSVMDLYRYASSGVRQLTSGVGSPSYFSIDSGATQLATWNSNPNSGDLGDWDSSVLSGTTVSSGGVLELFGGAVLSGTTSVVAGGTLEAISGFNLIVSSGQTSPGVVLLNGGRETVLSGGAATGTVVEGGTQLVLTGGSALSTTIISSGLVEVQAGGSASLVTISSGALKLDDSQHFGGSIAGLANSSQVVDLADINFSAGMTVAFSGTSAGGTLTVQNSSQSAQLTLLGNYLLATFTSASDGNGGTFITDPPVSSGSGAAPPH
jgi:autotransporter passenger strand-loop-strand repeat protein